MRRLAIIAACLLASAGLILLLAPSRASALTTPGLQKGTAHNDGLLLVRDGRRGFRGGHGFRGHAFRGGRGFRGHAFYGPRRFHGGRGFRGHAFYAPRRFHRGRVFRGHAFFGPRRFRGGRVYAFRGGHRWGHRRGWRGPRWGLALGTAAAAPFGYWGNCPLVRRTVWTPYGWRSRWVRRC